MADTGWVLNALDLRRIGYDISSVTGWDSFPGVRLQTSEYAYQHGNRFDQRGFYKTRLLGLQMTIVPYDPDGSQTYSNLSQHIQENVDAILGALHSLGNITISRTMPDTTVRNIEGRAIQAVPITDGPGVLGRNLGLLMECGYPFWRESGQQSVSGETGAFIATNDGNAPINNMVVTFNSPGRLTHDDSGDYIETDTDNSIVVDVGPRTVKLGSTFKDNRFGYNAGWFLQMEPGDNDFTVSGGGDVDMTWYHSWL